MSDDLKRILSLDGGGTWSLIQALTLDKLYPGLGGHELLARFDLVAANSGGSIVLAALACNQSPRSTAGSLLDEKTRREIFVDLPLYRKLPRILKVGPKYSSRDKRIGLKHFLKADDIALTDIPRRIAKRADRSPQVLITSFDYDRKRATFFRSNPHSLAANRSPPMNVTLLQAVHASTNAPVNYFDRPATVAANRYWDGGVAGYNNPVLCAVVEAVANNFPREQIRVLSIGTGHVLRPLAGHGLTPPLAEPRDRPGLLHDVKEIATSILDDPPDAASFIAHVMLAQPLPQSPGQCITDGAIVRMNPLIGPRKEGSRWIIPPAILDDYEALTNLDIDAVKQQEVERIKRLCDAWLTDQIPNQPIRASAEFVAEIGHATFSAAAERWRAFDK